jgi:hypothetical protein
MDDNTPTWRSLDQLGHLDTVEELTKHLGDKLIYGGAGAGAGWCNYADACQLNAEVQAERTAASEAAKRQQEALTAAVAAHSGPLHRHIRALAARDAQLRANGGDDLSSFQRMAVGDNDDGLDHAARRTQELFDASRNGVVGYHHRFTQKG